MLVGVIEGTIPLTIISFVIGLADRARGRAGPAVGAGRLADRAFYISVIRGTPLLVQLFIVFFGLPQIGIKLPEFAAAIIALSLNVGGYAAEIIRAVDPVGAARASTRRRPRSAWTTARACGASSCRRRRGSPYRRCRTRCSPWSRTPRWPPSSWSPELFREAQNDRSLSAPEFMALYALAALYYWVICW